MRWGVVEWRWWWPVDGGGWRRMAAVEVEVVMDGLVWGFSNRRQLLDKRAARRTRDCSALKWGPFDYFAASPSRQRPSSRNTHSKQHDAAQHSTAQSTTAIVIAVVAISRRSSSSFRLAIAMLSVL